MLFDQYINQFSILREAEEDDEDNYDIQGDEDGEETPEEQPDDNNTEDSPEDETQPEDEDSGESDEDDYDIQGDEDGEETPESSDDIEDSGEEPAGAGDSADPAARLKDLEKSIFDQLTPEQQKAKVKELKELYSVAITKCDVILDVVNGSEKNSDHIKVYEYITERLTDLKKYIVDYLTNIFDSKTYLENMTEFQKYLAVFNTINNIFDDIHSTTEEDGKK